MQRRGLVAADKDGARGANRAQRLQCALLPAHHQGAPLFSCDIWDVSMFAWVYGYMQHNCSAAICLYRLDFAVTNTRQAAPRVVQGMHMGRPGSWGQRIWQDLIRWGMLAARHGA